jgi:AraC-like DNA-binding protein
MADPLSKFPILDTDGLKQAEFEISKSLADSRVLHVADPATFHVKMNAVELGQTTIVFNRFSADAVVEAQMQEDVLHFVFGNGAPTEFVWADGSVTAEGGVCVTLPTGCGVKIHRPAGSEVLVVNAATAGLARHLQRLTGKRQRVAPNFVARVDTTGGVGAIVVRRLRFALDEVEADRSARSNPILRRSLDEWVLSTLLSLPHSESEALSHRLSHEIEPGPLSKAEAYVRSHFAEPITISSLLRVAGCRRTVLFTAFRAEHGCTPMEFVAELRLVDARDKLRTARAEDTVSSIAMGCGFTHLGRFAQRFRLRFGELPSETLSIRDQA